MIAVVIICLGTYGEKCEESLLNMLSVLLSDSIDSKFKKETLHNEFGIPMTEELEREVDDMCNLSQGVYDKALADVIRKMMDKKGWDIEECMDTLDIPKEKRAMYREVIFGVVTV